MYDDSLFSSATLPGCEFRVSLRGAAQADHGTAEPCDAAPPARRQSLGGRHRRQTYVQSKLFLELAVIISYLELF